MVESKNPIIKYFDNNEIDFFEARDKVWITSSAIAKGLGIDFRNINQIYQNNKALLDPYTCIMKIMMQDQKRDIRVFDKIGFIGICMRSNSLKAIPFQQFVLKIMDEIEDKGYYIEKARKDPFDLFVEQAEMIKESFILLKEQNEKLHFLESKVETVDTELKTFEHKYEIEKPIRTETVKKIQDLVHECVLKSSFRHYFFYKKIWDHFGIRSTKETTEPIGQEIVKFIQSNPIFKVFLDKKD